MSWATTLTRSRETRLGWFWLGTRRPYVGMSEAFTRSTYAYLSKAANDPDLSRRVRRIAAKYADRALHLWTIWLHNPFESPFAAAHAGAQIITARGLPGAEVRWRDTAGQDQSVTVVLGEAGP